MLIYLALGVLLVVLFHTVLSAASRTTPKTAHKASRWVSYILIALLALYLLRLGLVHYAAIVGFIGAVFALAQRAQMAHSLWRMFYKKKPQHTEHSEHKTSQEMTVEEASAILDIAADASEDEIQEAYRRLIRSNHPDQGGSRYLASQINLARDILLKHHSNFKGDHHDRT